MAGERGGAIRRHAVLVVLGVVAVGVVGFGLTRSHDGAGGSGAPPALGPPTTTDREPLTEPEGWSAMAASPLTGRARPVTAWTGSELLIWGGDGAFSDAGGGERGRSDGAAYDPRTDTWRAMASSPLPQPGNAIGASDYASAWTGRELLVWGGPGPEGAAYDPEADSWRRIAAGPLATRNQVAFAWTGTELAVVGGYGPIADEVDGGGYDGGARRDGAAYDPVTDTWRDLPATGLKRTGRLVWTGDGLLLLADSHDGVGSAGIGLFLAPDASAWRRTAVPPLARFDAPPVWTGHEVLAMGAAVRVDPAAPNEGKSHAGAATYDPVADRWTEVATPEGLRVDHLLVPSAVWSGQEVLLVGAPGFGAPDDVEVEGAAFDPDAGTWRAIPPPGLSGRGGMAAEWTGTELIVWGGAYYSGFTSEPEADGSRYRPGAGR